MAEPQSAYRCVPCGHGRHLTAWAGANIHGPLGADGKLAEYGYTEDTGIREGSIQCDEHPDGMLEKLINGTWHQWWQCPECHGKGRTRAGESWKAPNGYPCHGGREKPGPRGTRTSHEGWFPAEATAQTRTGRTRP
jgi:hypothetical protein